MLARIKHFIDTFLLLELLKGMSVGVFPLKHYG